MSIDARGRLAVTELREAAEHQSVPTLSDIARAGARRRQRRAGAVAAVCAGLLLAGIAVSGRLTASPDLRPVTPPTPSPSFGLACRAPGISCADGRLRVFDVLPVPISFIPIGGVNTDDITPANATLQINRNVGTRSSGVIVFEHPTPIDPRTSAPAAGLAGSGAADAAAWLAGLPFVAPTTVRSVVVGGHAGYRVDVTLREGATLTAFKAGQAAQFTFVTGHTSGLDWSAAVSASLRSSTYYLVDVPGHGLVVLWVWTWQGSASDVDALTPLIDSIQFG